MSKNEDKYVVKVVNWSEFHLSEMTLLQNPYFSRVLEEPGLKEIFFKIVLGLNIIYKCSLLYFPGNNKGAF